MARSTTKPTSFVNRGIPWTAAATDPSTRYGISSPFKTSSSRSSAACGRFSFTFPAIHSLHRLSIEAAGRCAQKNLLVSGFWIQLPFTCYRKRESHGNQIHHHGKLLAGSLLSDNTDPDGHRLRIGIHEHRRVFHSLLIG